MNAEKLKTLHSLASENDSENSGSTTNSLGEDCRVSSKKRKASRNCESPRKRQRDTDTSDTSEPTEVAVEALTGSKRKASSESDTPKKKRRSGNSADISEPTEVAVEDVTARGTKRKASAKTETPRKKQKGGNNHTDANTNGATKVSVENLRESEKEVILEQMHATERRDSSSSSSGTSTSEQDDGSTSSSVAKSRAAFENKYEQLDIIEKGGFGSVYAGYRKADYLPVAIKRIPKASVKRKPVVIDGNTYEVPMEVIFMLRAAGGPSSVGKSAAVSLLNWYDLDQEVLLVMERPVPAVDLLTYLQNNDGPLQEDAAKNIMKQLVDAAIKMHAEGVFHRDIKLENVLVNPDSDVPRVRIIDFGCACFVKKGRYRQYSGTVAYAPPEFHRRRRYRASPTTVWQLGALLFELQDGHEQFTTPKFLSKKIKVNSELSQDCQHLLKMCLAEKTVERATLQQMKKHPWFT